jgi:hypothetical protein
MPFEIFYKKTYSSTGIGCYILILPLTALYFKDENFGRGMRQKGFLQSTGGPPHPPVKSANLREMVLAPTDI